MFVRKFFIQNAFLTVIILLTGTTLSIAESDTKLSNGETVYVSIYSNLFVGNINQKFQLSALLSIRNTDPKYTITIMKVDYFDTDGKKINSHINRPVQLGPLASKYFFVEPLDVRGGEGANFLVTWSAERKVNQPIVEAVMLNVYNRQGVVFRCPGKIITEHRD